MNSQAAAAEATRVQRLREPSHEELRSRACAAEILGITVAVCSLEDLKTMKRAAGRTRDLADLEDLETRDC